MTADVGRRSTPLSLRRPITRDRLLTPAVPRGSFGAQPPAEWKGISLICADADVARELQTSRHEVAELKQQLAALQEARRQEERQALRSREAPAERPRPPPVCPEQQLKVQQLQDTVHRLQRDNADLSHRLQVLQDQNLQLNGQLQALSLSLEDKATVQVLMEQAQQDNEELRQRLEQAQVYQRDSSMYKALRAAESQVAQLQERNAQLHRACDLNSIPIPDMECPVPLSPSCDARRGSDVRRSTVLQAPAVHMAADTRPSTSQSACLTPRALLGPANVLALLPELPDVGASSSSVQALPDFKALRVAGPGGYPCGAKPHRQPGGLSIADKLMPSRWAETSDPVDWQGAATAKTETLYHATGNLQRSRLKKSSCLPSPEGTRNRPHRHAPVQVGGRGTSHGAPGD
uniref:Uncharacterized protein n=1 Tax=Eutreptiella gymnastica TaxID=73025 RepID=A0A7S1ILQ0_9EUGL|mmetsp:Transcript_27604/g.49745  ORF Transcript_27604/g.49745 Transcript_27604/m.49745 type:complete len:405 (+) Transcript_27604:80-1294(+)